MGRLAALARGGTTVVCVLHQPRREIVRLLDRVALAAGGRLRFLGPPADVDAAAPDAANPADALLDLSASAERLGALAAPARPRPFRGAFVAPAVPAARRPPYGYATLRLLAAREWRGVRRDASLLALHYGPAAAVGLVLGLAFTNLPARNGSAAGIQDRLGLAFVLCVAVGLSALSAPPRARRARLLARERDSYGGPAAFLAMCGGATSCRCGCCRRCSRRASRSPLARARRRRGWARRVAAALQLHYAFAALGRCLGALAPSDSVANAARVARAPLQPAALRLLSRTPTTCRPRGAAWRARCRRLRAGASWSTRRPLGIPELYLTSKVGAQKYRWRRSRATRSCAASASTPRRRRRPTCGSSSSRWRYECLTCFVFFWFGLKLACEGAGAYVGR